jgi:hypothetical protein
MDPASGVGLAYFLQTHRSVPATTLAIASIYCLSYRMKLNHPAQHTL